MWVDKINTPRTNKAFVAIKNTTFLGSNKIGAVGPIYENVLCEKLVAMSPQQLSVIDARLALGRYVIRTDAAKLKRCALRAVLLACAVMINNPRPADWYLQRYRRLGLSELRNAFFGAFPFIDNAAVRTSWSGHLFTNPGLATFAEQFAELRDWGTAAVPRFRFMVHCVGEPGTWAGRVNPVAELSKYDLTSMTLLDSTKRYTYFNWGGMVFNVPKSNILVTYSHDQMSDTHGGARGDVNGLALVNEIKSLAFGTGGLKTPEQVIGGQSVDGTYKPPVGSAATITSPYNEISICGRPRTPLPWGISGALELRAVFSLVPKNGNLVGVQLQKSQEWAAIGTALNVPMLYIPMM